MADDASDVTQLLLDLGEGDPEAMDRLLPIVYDELHRLAHRHRRGERPDHTLNTTALVHEAYLKLVRLDRLQWQNRAQFFALAAQAMRRVLITYAERRRAQKRGGGVHPIPLDENLLLTNQQSEELLALDEALERLKAMSERQHGVVECRFFGGLSVEETAAALGISPATVKRDWALARAWLNRELRTLPDGL
ncbi:MAG: sigma-70 family RNA polymerase sigma factor [Rhodothermaceae bacterium]|nr:sigma-70 family RNA polymerase sigma factor [Rhodothermaceae bacterium]